MKQINSYKKDAINNYSKTIKSTLSSQDEDNSPNHAKTEESEHRIPYLTNSDSNSSITETAIQNININEFDSVINNAIEAKSLTLKHLLFFIQDIYKYKNEFDSKYNKENINKITLEKIIYLYISSKFESNNIKIFSVIIESIMKYSQINNDVALFGKILRNECNEDFVSIQEEIKSLIHKYSMEAAKIYDETRVNKGNDHSKKNIRKENRNINDSKITDKKWKYIFKNLIDKFSDNLLISQNLALIEKNYNNSFIDNSKCLNLILDSILKAHEKDIEKYTDLFKSFDKDNDGIISYDDFNLIITHLKLNILEIQEKLLKNNAFQEKSPMITYSAFIKLLYHNPLKNVCNSNKDQDFQNREDPFHIRASTNRICL